MAKSIQNVVMQGASGKIGKTLVFRQMRNGETIIANRAKPSNLPLTPAQETHRSKFIRASYLAKSLLLDPMFGPQYLAKVSRGRTAYNVALTDCLTAPKIMEVSLKDYNGTIGDQIAVRATDDFMVTAVSLRILEADDNVIEEGMAALDNIGLDWVYVATVANSSAGIKIEITVTDVPGNETVEVISII